jgi:hypothetical protein
VFDIEAIFNTLTVAVDAADITLILPMTVTLYPFVSR